MILDQNEMLDKVKKHIEVAIKELRERKSFYLDSTPLGNMGGEFQKIVEIEEKGEEKENGTGNFMQRNLQSQSWSNINKLFQKPTEKEVELSKQKTLLRKTTNINPKSRLSGLDLDKQSSSHSNYN